MSVYSGAEQSITIQVINVKKTVVYIQVNGDRSKTAKITNDDITIIDIEAMELQ